MAMMDELTSADAKHLFEDSSIVVFKCAISKTYPIIFVSGNVREVLGFETNYFLSNETAWTGRIHPEDIEKVSKQFLHVKENGGNAFNEYRFRRKDGNYIWLRDEIKRQYDDAGNPDSILGTSFEITDRKKSEIEAQKEIENELRKRLSYQNTLSRCSNLLVDSSGLDTVEKALGILLEPTDADRVYIFTHKKDKKGKGTLSQVYEVCKEGINPEIDNPDLQDMPYDSLPWVFTELSQNRIINTVIKDLPSPEREFMMEEDIKSFLLLPIFIDDDWFGFMGFDSVRAEKEWDEHEIVVMKTAAEIIGTFFKRKSVEESLLHQKTYTRQILNSLPSIVVLMNKKMELIRWNKTAEYLTGYSAQEIKKMTAYDIIAPEDHEKMENALSRIINKENEGQELNLLHKSGEKNPYFWRGSIIELEGEPMFVNVGLNVAKQKEMENAVMEEKRLADAIINSLPGIFYVINKEGRYVRVNQNLIKEFGYSEREVLDMSPLDFFDEEEQKFVLENIEEVFTKGVAEAELLPKTKSGEKLPYYFNAVRFDRMNESYLIGTGHNISEQKQKEAELQTSIKEKQVLLQEIHHRVKNNLAVISGLLQLQAYEFEDPEFQRLVLDSQRRIQTMAMIHEKLYRSESLSQISALHYIDDLIHQIESTFTFKDKNIEVETEIDNINLNINQAIPFALAINEIVSNSFEHAFKGRKKGKVSVVLHESEGIINTIIKDNGKGMDKTKGGTSLGTTLITALLKQLEAKWRVEDKKGVTYFITFSKDEEKGSSSSLDDL